MALAIMIRSVLSPIRTCSFNHNSIAMSHSLMCSNMIELTSNNELINYNQSRGAARKGIRIRRAQEARARAARRRQLEAANPKLKKNIRKNIKIDKDLLKFMNERQLDMTLPPPPSDDVYFNDKYRKPRLSFEDIIELMREVCHPDILNQPDALVSATVELNVKMKLKKRKYIDSIRSTVGYPYPFKYQLKPRKIIALCKNPEDQEAARQAGAFMAGAADIAALLKTNQLTQRDFDHIVCHNDFLSELAAVKGMKSQKYFPTKQRANFGENIVELVKYFKDGVDYELRKPDDDQSYGSIDCYFGKLDMTNDQLKSNLLAFFESVNRFKPLNLVDGKQFFERVLITTPATQEVFLLRFWDLLDEYQDPETIVIEDEDNAKKATS